MEQLQGEPDILARLQGELRSDRQSYYYSRLARIATGKPTWILLDADTEHGETYDFFVGGQYVAQIGYDYERPDEIEVYRVDPETSEPSLISVRDSLAVAADMVEAAFAPELPAGSSAAPAAPRHLAPRQFR